MRIGIRTSAKPVKKTFGQAVSGIIKAVEDIAEMQKAGGHKYVKREGSPGHYKYWYRLPDGRLGSREDLNAATRKPKEDEGNSTKKPVSENVKKNGTANDSEKGGSKDTGKKLVAEAKTITGWKKTREIGSKLYDAIENGEVDVSVIGDEEQAAQLVRLTVKAILDGKNNINSKEAEKYAHVMYSKKEYQNVFQWVKNYLLKKAKPEQNAGKRLGIRKPSNKNKDSGKSEFKRGDKASGVDVNGEKVSGTVTAVGADGITVDGQFHIEHGKAEKEKPSGKYKIGDKVKRKGVGYQGQDLSVTGVIVKINDDGTYKLKKEDTGGLYNASEKELEPVDNKNGPQRTFISPDKFNASDYAKQWDDPKATADEAGKEYILKSFGAEGEEIANAIRTADSDNQRLDREKQLTWQLYRTPNTEGESARYTPEREKLHGRIMAELLHPDKIRSALPSPGQKPKFTILGGRGGSGKSWFKNHVYDPDTTVVLDADSIKEMLPEYKGWNANQVHEESSDILEQMLSFCIRNGLNVVLDATMKTANSALAKVFRFKSAGYKTEAHYMHCPKQVAAKRAVMRFKGQPEKGKEDEYKPFNGRYVPITAVLKNTTNEDSFEQVRKFVDEWSFRDSNGKNNEQPILISEGKTEVKKSFSALVKKVQQMYN
jgi:predicted kinase